MSCAVILTRLPDLRTLPSSTVATLSFRATVGMSTSLPLNEKAEVREAIERLARFGGKLLRAPDAPPHGGFRGYVADPDGHPWEIAWNPAWPISPEGHVTFKT